MSRKIIVISITLILMLALSAPVLAFTNGEPNDGANGSKIYLPVVSSGSQQGGDAPDKALALLSGKTVDLLIRTNGSINALAAQIRSVGGKVNHQYKNVPIVAATIPLDKWSSVTGFAGVVQVEKDALVKPTFDKDSRRPMSFKVNLAEGETVTALEATSPADLPQGYDNFMLSGANLTWGETGEGAGSIVAVVDTGTAPNVCLQHAVIGAPGFPDGYNATGDGIPANSELNEPHGTRVGGVIASRCVVTLSPDDPLYIAVNKYLPEIGKNLPILGQAPLAQIYPVKVFPADGSDVPLSVIFDGLDHVLSLKKSGALDIDVVNMSLGAPALYDGRDTFAAFVTALTQANILVVSAACNAGPTPNTICTPAASDQGIAAGGLDYALPSRIFWEYWGMVDLGASGQGEVIRPTSETRVVNFSSRGPLGDGREGPDLSALALWNFFADPNNELVWGAGTSFASPSIAGGAALLNAYMEKQGQETNPRLLKNALLAGADPTQVGAAWQAHNDQGFGVLDVPAALDVLKNRPQTVVPLPQGGNLKANVFKQPVKGKVDSLETSVITLNPAEKVDFILEVNQYTSKVSFDVVDITTPDNHTYAYWPNELDVNLQGARRSNSGRPIWSVLWAPYRDGTFFNITVEDGPWTFAGIPWFYKAMEPGLMKFTLAGDFTNESPVSFKVRIVRENFRPADKTAFAKGQIRQSEQLWIPVPILAGKTQAQFDLNWLRDWTLFPTSDIDMYVIDPAGNWYFDGVSMNAPERQVIDSPMEGIWYVVLYGYELYRPDTYNLYVKLE
jgi:hypothetical protein